MPVYKLLPAAIAVIALGFAGAPAPALAQSEARPLKLVVLEGGGAINNIRQHTAKAPVVRVEDETGRPVSGAVVSFVLPDIGASGVFGEYGRTMTVTTSEDGRAIGRGLRPNNIAGPFQVRVAASHMGRRASAVIEQTNAAPEPSGTSSRKKFAILGIAAGAAIATAFALVGAGSSSQAPPAASAAPTNGRTGTVVAPGSPVFGPPR